MAGVESKTIVVEQTAEQRSRLKLCQGHGPADTTPELRLARTIPAQPLQSISEEEIVWQGRPPFPGILKQMRNSRQDGFHEPGHTSL